MILFPGLAYSNFASTPSVYSSKALTSAGPDHETQLCGLQWAYTTDDSCPRTFFFLETMTPSAFDCMRLRQLDSSVPPPRREMTHEGPMQGYVPRTVLLNNNNIAVPKVISPNVDHDKDVTSRHGFTAMVSQLSRIIKLGRGVSCAQDTRRHAIVWKCPSTANLSLRLQGPLHNAHTPHLCKVRYEPTSLPCPQVPFLSTSADFTRATTIVIAVVMLLAPDYLGLPRL